MPVKSYPALQYKGIMNIQFLLQGQEVYVLEVNPRASRTVPIVSKIIGFSLIDMATDLMCGESLTIDAFEPPSEVKGVGVKYPVFSSHALPEIDQILGANMKSTGEGLCMGDTVEEALYKVFEELHGGVEAGGTVYVDCEQTAVKQFQTAEEASFNEWIETDHACVYFNDEETDMMKKRRIAALEAGVTVITEAETLHAFMRSKNAEHVQPKPLVHSKSIQGVSRV